MEKFKELTESILSGELIESKQTFKEILAEKINDRLDEMKKGRYDKDLDADKDGKLTKKDFKLLRGKKKAHCCDESVEDLDEVLHPSMGVKAYIDDFIKSDDARFSGDSKDQRIKRAVAAFYSDQKNK